MTTRAIAFRLVCAACGALSDERARGWRAFLGTEDDDSTVEVFCPACATREFGGRD